MFAQGQFELGTSSGLTLPQQAVVIRDGFSHVFRLGSDNRVSELKVKTGRRNGDQVEVVEGLSPDDLIVVSGAGFLNDGDLVKVVAPKPPTQAGAK
jgi:multidrug efflux pump subunit AcrA (membrane-fusion protein)